MKKAIALYRDIIRTNSRWLDISIGVLLALQISGVGDLSPGSTPTVGWDRTFVNVMNYGLPVIITIIVITVGATFCNRQCQLVNNG